MSVMGYDSRLRNTALVVMAIPISFISNVFRVISLVLITYYFGDEAGQGFIHEFAGILLFIIATLLTIGIDAIFGYLISKFSYKQSGSGTNQ